MKVTSTKVEPQFKPITVSITLETEEEARAFYAAMNYTPMVDFMKQYGLEPILIREKVGREYHKYELIKEIIQYVNGKDDNF